MSFNQGLSTHHKAQTNHNEKLTRRFNISDNSAIPSSRPSQPNAAALMPHLLIRNPGPLRQLPRLQPSGQTPRQLPKPFRRPKNQFPRSFLLLLRLPGPSPGPIYEIPGAPSAGMGRHVEHGGAPGGLDAKSGTQASEGRCYPRPLNSLRGEGCCKHSQCRILRLQLPLRLLSDQTLIRNEGDILPHPAAAGAAADI